MSSPPITLTVQSRRLRYSTVTQSFSITDVTRRRRIGSSNDGQIGPGLGRPSYTIVPPSSWSARARARTRPTTVPHGNWDLLHSRENQNVALRHEASVLLCLAGGS